MFDSQLRCDIETLDVTINNYERLANAPQAWIRIKTALQNVESANSLQQRRYAAALEVLREWETDKNDGEYLGFMSWIQARLNSAKQDRT